MKRIIALALAAILLTAMFPAVYAAQEKPGVQVQTAQLLEAIESHMGRWNTSKHAPGITLPRPLSEAAWIVHTADFIASRKHISVEQK